MITRSWGYGSKIQMRPLVQCPILQNRQKGEEREEEKGKRKGQSQAYSCKARHVPVISARERLKQAEKVKVSLGCTVHPFQPEL